MRVEGFRGFRGLGVLGFWRGVGGFGGLGFRVSLGFQGVGVVGVEEFRGLGFRALGLQGFQRSTV